MDKTTNLVHFIFDCEKTDNYHWIINQIILYNIVDSLFFIIYIILTILKIC